MNHSKETPNHDLLREIFFVPTKRAPSRPKEKWNARKRNKGDLVNPEPKPEPNLGSYTLSKVASGFAITKGQPGVPFPAEIRIAVAYDRRRGSPLAKYSPFDFKINETPLAVEVSGGQVTEALLNRLVVRITDADFRVKVTGFDENRDLFVDVDAKDAIHNTQV
jgi:hypothetical protein